MAANGYTQRKSILEAELAKIATVDPESGDRFVSPQRMVDVAEDPNHPLHLYFEWDQSKAANAHRLWQARHLINHHHLVVEDRQIDAVSTMTSLQVDRRSGLGYRFTTDVLARRDLREAMLSEALNDLNRVELKYRHLTELTDVWLAIDSANGDIA